MNSISLQQILENMWQDYLRLNPGVEIIYQLLAACNKGRIVNDHIALRTFNHPKVNIDQVAAPFLQAGYALGGDYIFKEKKLYAKYYVNEDPSLPKIFISELCVEQLSDTAQGIIEQLLEQLEESAVSDPCFCYSGRPWEISYSSYQSLLKESEYAAWMSAFGYRPNHFTVSVNQLISHTSIESLNQFLRKRGFVLNTSGGEVKGSPSVFLEQSSTLANKIKVPFSDQIVKIPSCYYEFARRYPQPNGKLYQGFVATSADKIFESTDANH